MADLTPTALLRLLLPRAPSLALCTLQHTLGLSPTSRKWDLRTELAVRILRDILNPRARFSISSFQTPSLRDPGIGQGMWVAKVLLPAPVPDERNGDVRALLVRAIEEMGDGGEKYTIPELVGVEAEWTGHRAAAHDSPSLEMSESEHYVRMMAEVETDVTILYLHGGAHFLCDPATHRIPVANLARLTRGRCLSVRYRLAPQYPFPAALLDALVAYISLLCPAPDALHEPVPASRIVVAGDSSGGGLALALLQLLLHLQQQQQMEFHNRKTTIPLPAGVAAHCGWLDLTRCMPSIQTNADWDYLPPPLTRDFIRQIPACDIWPTDPLRADLYCDTSLMCHPLASPLAATSWQGSCPLWLCYGQEMLLDEGKAVAQTAARQGVSVIWEEWEAMPHCFAQLLTWLPQARTGFAHWAAFCNDVVDEAGPQERKVRTRGTWYGGHSGLQQREVDVEMLEVWDRSEIRRRMGMARDQRAGMVDVDSVGSKL